MTAGNYYTNQGAMATDFGMRQAAIEHANARDRSLGCVQQTRGWVKKRSVFGLTDQAI
jgi:hypothetical protein